MNELLGDLDESELEESEVLDSEGGEVITLNPVLCKVIRWKARLTPEKQAGTPEILCLSAVTISREMAFTLISRDIYLADYLRDTNIDSYAFFVRTRWEYVSTPEGVYEKLLQYESDKAARQRFMEVFGRGIQESHIPFAYRRYVCTRPCERRGRKQSVMDEHSNHGPNPNKNVTDR
ncbi:hypothetical protein EDC04DRAFT_2809167 [Pisolithus marmoratus]|nr:hypothetical protein EDC04DRAFT_2809167 [Pisolithus marmoratus]